MIHEAVSRSRLRTDTAGVETVRTLGETGSGLEVSVVDTVQAIEQSRWNAVVERSTRGSVFHRYEWVDAIESGLGHPARHLVVEKDGNTVGLFPNFVVDVEKTPFRRLTSVYPGFGGPLLPTDTKAALSLVIDAVPDLCTGRTIVHEIRARDMSYLRYNDTLQARGYRPVRTGCRFLIDLAEGYDAVLEGMSRGRRNGIERGREHDHEIVEADVTRENLLRFRDVHERRMDHVGGRSFPPSFFEKLLAMDSRVLLLEIHIDGEYAGGMVELLNDEQSSVHGFFAAVPGEYLEYHASELLYDYVIRWGIDHGYETYDLGDTGTDFEDGVFRFKEGFGGDLVPNLFWERGTGPLWKLVDAGRSLYWRRYK